MFQAVEMLRSTGRSVQLKLVRYLHGFKFEQLQQAIANSSNHVATPSSIKQSTQPQQHVVDEEVQEKTPPSELPVVK
jgi:hypothetical protein